MRTGNAAGSTNLKKPCRSDLQRFVFFNSCGTCWSRQTNTYTSMYIQIYIYYIHPWITIYDLFNTSHYWARINKTEKNTFSNQKNQRSHISIWWWWRERDISIYIFLPLGAATCDPPSTAMAWKARLVSVVSRVGCRSFSAAAGTAPFLGIQLFAVQVSIAFRHHSQPEIPRKSLFKLYINYPYTLFSYKFIYICIYIYVHIYICVNGSQWT